MRRVTPIILTPEQRESLESWSRGRNIAHKVVMRSRLILLAAEERTNREIGSILGVSQPTVKLWRDRFQHLGPEGLLKDAPRPGRKPKLPEQTVQAIIEATLHTKPPDATHWSTRSMAKKFGISKVAVHRVWRTHNLKPHLVRTFKLSNDPKFAEKLQDVIGLYLSPPDHALVFSLDEKSQIQALDRTQPLLPLREGLPERQTHDYKRNGTTTLFAALNVLDGTVIHRCEERHRHQEFLKFLHQLNRDTPEDLQIHVILDNYCTHKHKAVKDWLKRHPRFHFHFTPTSSSWLNLIERWFGELTRKRIRRGTFPSVKRLIQAIEDYVKLNNDAPRTFAWTKSADEILAKVAKVKELYETGH